MSALRKMERSVVKAKATKNREKFSGLWEEFRKKKYVVEDSDGNVVSDSTPRNTMKKKRPHFDNREQYINMFSYFEGIKKRESRGG